MKKRFRKVGADTDGLWDIIGGKMSNTTHVIEKLAGIQVSDRVAYSNRYKR